MQNAWQIGAEEKMISQITQPDILLDFITHQPGLEECCRREPERFCEFAPQLTIPGFGGPFERMFDELLSTSITACDRDRVAGSKYRSFETTNGLSPACFNTVALRHPTFGDYEPAFVACGFVQGFGDGLGPSTRAHDVIDYAVWLLSSNSDWLPRAHHAYLLQGMKDWTAWTSWDMRSYSDYEPNTDTGSFLKALYAARSIKSFRLAGRAKRDIERRISYSAEYLGLLENGHTLMDRFITEQFVEKWFHKQSEVRDKNRRERRKAGRVVQAD